MINKRHISTIYLMKDMTSHYTLTYSTLEKMFETIIITVEFKYKKKTMF